MILNNKKSARQVLRASLIVEIDYYAAPNCSALCSSGSGTPKADGTQECNCQENKQATINVAYWEKKMGSGAFKLTFKRYGFNSSNGSISNNSYRGTTITALNTNNMSASQNDISIATEIDFAETPNDLSDIKIRVNGVVYTFTKTSSAGTTFGCSSKIFSSTGTYTIEFLN